jgi:hypothetical protein
VDEWLEAYRRMWDERLDRLDDYLQKLQGQKLQGRKKSHGRKK